MKILIFDSDYERARKLEDVLSEHLPDTDRAIFKHEAVFLHQLQQDKVDVVFLRIESEEIGRMLIENTRNVAPYTNIIIVSDNDLYAYVALKSRVSGYILEPFHWDDVFEEMRNLRFPIVQEESRLYFQAFGIFDVFYEDKPVELKYTKSRELLAYLFFRNGSMCDQTEIISTLFNEGGHYDYLRQMKKDINDMADRVGIHDLVRKKRGLMGINMALIVSDYDAWLQGKSGSKSLYQGEFLKQYPWAQEKNKLIQKWAQENLK